MNRRTELPGRDIRQEVKWDAKDQNRRETPTRRCLVTSTQTSSKTGSMTAEKKWTRRCAYHSNNLIISRRDGRGLLVRPNARY